MASYSLYLHIPFCRHRCSYCDFNTYAGLESLVSDYVNALCRELEKLGQAAGTRLPVHTVFFGGGTPSLLPPADLERILRILSAAFDLLPSPEITLEANPGTLSLAYLKSLRSLGVNRLSLGMQSAHPEELRLLERQHDYFDIVQAVSWARQAGFDNLNLDLIFGLPYQSVEKWKNNLDFGIALTPDHLSLYALTLEYGTPMAHWVERGLLASPDPDLGAEMYEWAGQRLESAGYLQYEISNWARPDEKGNLLACQHNLQYWRNLPYLGVGAGAHGFAAGIRTANVLSPSAYIQRCLDHKSPSVGNRNTFPRTQATANAQSIDRQSEIGETIMMGLRLTHEGISRTIFYKRFGQQIEDIFRGEIEELIRLDLLEWTGENLEILRLTPRGRLLGNQVFLRFI